MSLSLLLLCYSQLCRTCSRSRLASMSQALAKPPGTERSQKP
jgi:hypothetical protein